MIELSILKPCVHDIRNRGENSDGKEINKSYLNKLYLVN